MDLLPKVFRTEGNIAEFDPSKIFESILKETGMSETDAKHITELVVRRIISSGIKFLSGPHIREIVCSILSEQHFENERKLYTRIGMPLMDYEEILKRESSNELKKWINPERINHWSANQLAEEYTHLRILNNEESKAHLFGDIHINGLCYFDLRPFTQIWDPRLLLISGFPPIDYLREKVKQKPPNTLTSTLSHFSKWLGMVQAEFYGNQGFNLITIFLAPYITNLSEEKIKQEIRKLIYEINLLPIITGREIPSISLSSSISVLESYSKVPAINPNGIINNIYEDYGEQCFKLFKALICVFKELSQKNINYLSPNLQIIVDNKFFEEVNQSYLKFWDDINAFNDFSFINFCLNTCYKRNLEKSSENNLKNFGVLQNISLNLPRYAYISRDEGKFLELLNSKVILSSEILVKKYQIIKERLKLKQLPCCGSLINKEPLFKLENQDLSISLVGLNESVKFLTNFEIHEHSDAIKLSMRILNELNKICVELTENHDKNFIISENLSRKAIKRFTKLDLKHFPKEVKLLFNNQNYKYTNSIHFRNNVELDLFKRIEIQGDFHQFIQNGAIEYISLNDLKENNLSIQEFINIISKKSKISSVNFYP
ncbi:MAG: hypothetical protein HWN81_12295 [Candidatus Lokiarchaeota archaeon]|nr:hypothetical protein [Candidatus Lokiarchaeota archaeon]